MNSQRLKQQAQGWHRTAAGPLCIYCGFQFSISMGLTNAWVSESLIHLIFLVALFLLTVCLAQLLYEFFVLLLFILLCLVVNLLEACSCLMTDRKEVNLEGRGGREE